MNSHTGEMLINEVIPRLANLVPHSVVPVGGEDTQELLQDGIAMAGQLLDRCAQAGKTVTPGNIAYYVTLSLKQGRRSTSAGATDVMGPATQVRGRSATVSMDQPIGTDTEDPMTLADMLADYREDPATQSLRNLDWEKLAASSTPPGNDGSEGIGPRTSTQRDCSGLWGQPVVLQHGPQYSGSPDR